MATDDLFGLDGKTAAVIGAGSGIGEAVARGCVRQGAYVVCLDANAEAVKRVAGGIGAANAESAVLDIRDGKACADAFGHVVKTRGRLDIVICTPSINVRKRILDYTEEEFDRVLAVNMKGSFNVLREAGRIMTAQKSGSIVLFSSIRSLVVEPGQAAYAATKAGILQMVRGAASEFGAFGVRVNAVGPGVVETPLTAPIKANAEWYDAYANKNALKRWASPDEMIGPTLFLVSDAASYVTGTIIYADGGWTAQDGRFTPPGM